MATNSNEPVVGTLLPCDEPDKIKFACPKCGKRMSSPVGYAGKEITCRKCGIRLLAPTDPANDTQPIAEADAPASGENTNRADGVSPSPSASEPPTAEPFDAHKFLTSLTYEQRFALRLTPGAFEKHGPDARVNLIIELGQKARKKPLPEGFLLQIDFLLMCHHRNPELNLIPTSVDECVAFGSKIIAVAQIRQYFQLKEYGRQHPHPYEWLNMNVFQREEYVKWSNSLPTPAKSGQGCVIQLLGLATVLALLGILRTLVQ